MKLFQSVFADIPYPIHVEDEHYYQAVCHVICDLLNLMVQAEICTNNGRIDMAIRAGEWIFVLKFKLNKTADEAMKQIEHKGYALKYRKESKCIMLFVGQFRFWHRQHHGLALGRISVSERRTFQVTLLKLCAFFRTLSHQKSIVQFFTDFL